ncbi:hypothetical protein F5Y15DRAFT_156579 [Xylariaceae sp. FL0016]|nr:hypothetical protein F5Y15DRAFT_156579 [Xylariaceae sp. FL0016]
MFVPIALAFAFYALNILVDKYATGSMMKCFHEDPVWLNFTAAVQMSPGATGNLHNASNGVLSIEVKNTTESDGSPKIDVVVNTTHPGPYNITSLLDSLPSNATTEKDNSPRPLHDEPLWTVLFPVSLAIFLLLAPLDYHWNMYLERLLPTRRRAALPPPEHREKFAVGNGGDDESREEEIVRKWIAQGKVRRASVSWLNTFVKWVLTTAVWNPVCHCLRGVLETMLRLQAPWKILKMRSIMQIFLQTLSFFFGFEPLITLIGLFLVPASKRLPFKEGMSLLAMIVLIAFLQLIIPWGLKHHLVQQLLRNQTEAIYLEKQQPVTIHDEL